MILGVGSDIVNIKRIEKTISRYGDKFIKRCFTNELSFDKLRRAKQSIFSFNSLLDCEQYDF